MQTTSLRMGTAETPPQGDAEEEQLYSELQQEVLSAHLWILWKYRANNSELPNTELYHVQGKTRASYF